MDDQCKFKIGDVVNHKSNLQQKMVVVGCYKENIQCRWGNIFTAIIYEYTFDERELDFFYKQII